MNNYDKRQIPEVQFFFETKVQPEEIEFLLRKKEAIKKMIKEKVTSEEIDKRLEKMGLSGFEGE